MTQRLGKQAMIVGVDQPIEVWERAFPAPEPGGVLLRMQMGGVCGTDVHLWRGHAAPPLPVVLGHEGVGLVEELGEGVSADHAGLPLGVGDRVYWGPIRPCHHCYYCTVAKDFSLCENLVLFSGADEPTWNTYTDYAWLPSGMCFYKIPDDTPSEPVIAFGCAMPTMIQAFERLGGLAPNQTVVVQGCGPVGLAATLLSHLAGAKTVITIGAPDHRLAMARRLGARTTINFETLSDEKDRLAQVYELTDGRGADVVIEATGAYSAFAEGLKLAAPNGRYVIVGLWSGHGEIPIDPRYINNRNLSIIGSALTQPQHYYEAIRVAQAHHTDFPMAEAITHRFAIEESQQALEAVERQETIKALIVPA